MNPSPIFNISQARCKPETSFYDLHLRGLPEPLQPFATEARRRQNADFFRIAKIPANLTTSLPSAARLSVLNLRRGGANEAAPPFHSESDGTGRTPRMREQRATT